MLMFGKNEGKCMNVYFSLIFIKRLDRTVMIHVAQNISKSNRS